MTRTEVGFISVTLVAIVALVALVLPRTERVDRGAGTGVQVTPSAVIRTVSSVAELRLILADNAVTEIVVADGTYVVPGASSIAGGIRGLWIDERFAGRTNPVLVRAETTGGVTFSGAGAGSWIGLAFNAGAHDQTWQGFRFANAEPTQTGVIVFGQSGSNATAPPYNITLRDITIAPSITSDNPVGMSGDHAVYFSKSLGDGVHDILIDGLTVNAATSGLDSAIHFWGSAPGAPNARNVTIRRMIVTGTDQAVILWDSTLRDILIEDSTIRNATNTAIRYEAGGTVTLANITSTGSGQRGFYSSLGANPPGVTFLNNSLR